MNVNDFLAQAKELKQLKTWPEYREKWRAILEQHEDVTEAFSKWTVKKLSKFTGRREKKATLVKMAVEYFYTQFCIPFDAGCITTRSGGIFDKRTDQECRMEFFENYTEGRFQKYLERQKETKKAIENPVTIDQFRTKNAFVGLTNPEAVEFYRLLASSHVKRNKKPFKVPKIQTANFSLTTAFHDKKEITLYVAQMIERVEREEFLTLKQRARKFGGWYSSYSKGNAKPGFQFEDETKVKQFAGIEDFDTEKLRDEIEAAKSENRADRIRTLAERWEKEGEESLYTDRLDNTARRAAMAAHQEERAQQKINRAQTLRNIADALDMGQAGALAGIKYASDLETLFSVRSRAWYAYISSQKITPDKYPPFDLNVMMEYVKWPKPMVSAERLKVFIPFASKRGFKLSVNRILKKMKKGEIVDVSRVEADIKKCLPLLSDKWDKNYFEEAFTDSMRLQRMGLKNAGHLIGALSELEKHIPSEGLKDEIENRKIDRSFVGKNIDGFFPTPEPLALDMLGMIDFPEGCKVAEPNAGLGHIAKLLPSPDCYEINYNLSEALNKKGFNVVGSDWLQAKTQYDRIVMNPPFEKGQAEQHIKHAYDLLNEGGKIVAVVPSNVSDSFRDWILCNGRLYPIREGEFKTAFRRTGVNVRLVYLEK